MDVLAANSLIERLIDEEKIFEGLEWEIKQNSVTLCGVIGDVNLEVLEPIPHPCRQLLQRQVVLRVARSLAAKVMPLFPHHADEADLSHQLVAVLSKTRVSI